jgi:RNA polymerase sigma factor (TIGR02999 family)
MSDATPVLSKMAEGAAYSAEQLLPLVYDELRKLAAAKLVQEPSGQTLQGTALVHEAYLRLVGVPQPQQWSGRGHFFAAAAEAMRRILVENARKKRALQRGGDRGRVELELNEPMAPELSRDVLALNDALENLEQVDRRKADLVKLRYFAGMTLEQAADALGVSLATAHRSWNYARAWLHQEIAGKDDVSG